MAQPEPDPPPLLMEQLDALLRDTAQAIYFLTKGRLWIQEHDGRVWMRGAAEDRERMQAIFTYLSDPRRSRRAVSPVNQALKAFGWDITLRNNRAKKTVEVTGQDAYAFKHFMELTDEHSKRLIEKRLAIVQPMRKMIALYEAVIQQRGLPSPQEHENAMTFLKATVDSFESLLRDGDLQSWEEFCNFWMHLEFERTRTSPA